MNYLTLALRLHYTKERFDEIVGKLNVVYYTIAALNTLLPFVRQALYATKKWVVALMIEILVMLLWIFTAVVIFWALVLVKKCSAYTRIYLNAKATYRQALSILLFAFVGVLIGITEGSYFVLQE